MTSNFPGALDSFIDVVPGVTKLNAPGVLHSTEHNNLHDAIEQLEQKIGLGASTPTPGTVLGSDEAGHSTWMPRPWVGVQAVGDGVTDDTAAFQAALDVIIATGRGTVLVPEPPVAYMVRPPLTLQANTTMFGVGLPIIRIMPNMNGGRDPRVLVPANNATDITLINLMIDGNAENIGFPVFNGGAFHGSNSCKNIRMHQMFFVNTWKAAIQTSGVSGTKTRNLRVSNFGIRNTLAGNGAYIANTEGGLIENGVISGSYDDGWASISLRLSGGSNSDFTSDMPISNVVGYRNRVQGSSFQVSGERNPLTNCHSRYAQTPGWNPAWLAGTRRTLNGAVGSGDTTITVNSTAGFAPSGYALIVDPNAIYGERVFYTGITPTTLTGVTRGLGGTTAAAHVTHVGLPGTDTNYGVYPLAWTALTAAIDATSTAAIGVADTSLFDASGVVQCGDELIGYTGKTATTLTGITRGLGTGAGEYHESRDFVFPARSYSTLSIDHTAVVAVITLTDATSFPTAGSGIIISAGYKERFSWTGKAGSTLTGVTRGIQFTVGTAVTAGAYVVLMVEAGDGSACGIRVRHSDNDDFAAHPGNGTSNPTRDSAVSLCSVYKSNCGGVQCNAVRSPFTNIKIDDTVRGTPFTVGTGGTALLGVGAEQGVQEFTGITINGVPAGANGGFYYAPLTTASATNYSHDHVRLQNVQVRGNNNSVGIRLVPYDSILSPTRQRIIEVLDCSSDDGSGANPYGVRVDGSCQTLILRGCRANGNWRGLASTVNIVSTTAAQAIGAADTTIFLASIASLPTAGTLVITDASGATERIEYGSTQTGTTTVADGGDGIDASQTTIGVASTAAMPAAGAFWIGTEKITYTGKTSTTLTGCTRGAFGSVAATAAEGATVTFTGVAGVIRGTFLTTATTHLTGVAVATQPFQAVDLLQCNFRRNSNADYSLSSGFLPGVRLSEANLGTSPPLTFNAFSASRNNGGSVSHGLVRTPVVVHVTPGVLKRMISVTGVTATTVTVSLHDDTGAAIAGSETMYFSFRC